MIQNSFSSIGIFSPDVQSGLIETNENITITTEGSTDPTLGDGTIKAKIWYKIMTFG